MVRNARRTARMSQASLATLAGTTQSAIARLETGATSPSLERVHELVRLCGFDLDVEIVSVDPDEWAQARRNLSLTPDQRVRNMLRTQRFIAAGRESRGR